MNAFPEFLGREAAAHRTKLRDELGPIADVHPVAAVIRRMDGLSARERSPLVPPPVSDIAAAIERDHGPDAAGRYAKLLVLELLRRFPERAERWNLPRSVMDHYPAMLAQVARSLPEIADRDYLAPDSDACKDIRLAAGLSVPVGASQLVDLSSYLGPSFWRNQGWTTNLRHLRFVLSTLRGTGPLLRVHTDTRNLTDFTKAGWERCYLRMADLLEAFPSIRGLVGTSWFYDPQLERITPHLRYLRMPVVHGALLRRDGTSDAHTQRAIAQSSRRRKLYEEGKYLPVCYTLVWPRRALLRWARTMKGRAM